MSLESKILEDLKTSLREKDTIKVSTLRLLKSAIDYAKIEKREETLKENDLATIIKKQVKQRKDAIESYEKGGREDLKEKEAKELAILEEYLPPQLTKEEIEVLINDTIKDINASTKKDMGRVIKEVMSRTHGAACGKLISEIVGNKLN